jgi:hypothetical protein
MYEAYIKTSPASNTEKGLQQVLILSTSIAGKNHVKSDKNTHKFHIFSLALKPFLPSTHDEHERELVHTTPHHTRVD